MLKTRLVCALALLLASLFPLSSAAKPVIFWSSDPVFADETVLISGADLLSVTSVLVSTLDRNPDGITKIRNRVRAVVLQQNEHSLKFLIPREFPIGAYQFELLAGTEIVTGTLNQPRVYWSQGDGGAFATRSGWVRVIGKNVSSAPSAILEFNFGKFSKRTQMARGDSWDATFPIPDGAPLGKARLRLWNGVGDSSTWMDAGDIDILVEPAPLTTRINVRDAGAKGNGTSDDSQIIIDSLRLVQESGGGVVYLPPGKYLVSRPLVIPPGVSLSGAEIDSTSLVWPDIPNPPPALISGYSDFAIENITIVAQRTLDVIRAGFRNNEAGQDGRNILLRRIRTRTSGFFGHVKPAEASSRLEASLLAVKDGPATVRLAGSNLRVLDCDLLGVPRALVLTRPVRSNVSGNTLRNGRLGWYSISGADGVVFERNHVIGADSQSTGGGINTISSDVAYSQNVLVKDNTFDFFLGWDREALTTDGPGGFYFGSVSAVNGREIHLVAPVAAGAERRSWNGAGVFILSGTGRGQYGQVASRLGNTIQLKTELLIAPSLDSVVTIVPMQQRYLIINNRFTDAGVAVQLFGTAIEHIVAGNTSDRTSGFVSRALVYQHAQPSFYNQFLGNEIRSLDPSKETSIAVWATVGELNREILNYATILRKNILVAGAVVDIRGGKQQFPALSDAIVEGTVSELGEKAIVIDKGAVDVIVRNNRSAGSLKAE